MRASLDYESVLIKMKWAGWSEYKSVWIEMVDKSARHYKSVLIETSQPMLVRIEIISLD
jgi:hypothetical protein